MLQGKCSFPGIQQIVEASISFVHGISPSVAVVTIAPQRNFIGEGGDLVFSFNGTESRFKDCKIDQNSFERTAEGEVWRLQIFDRRWKWSMGAVGGCYNLRDDDGSIKDGTLKTPQQLAKLCLDAVDEFNIAIGDLPNNARPEVQWDYDVPMEALARLCDELGCRIVLQLDDKVAIRKAGEGRQLPVPQTVMERSLTIDPPEMPDIIAIVCAPDLFQHDFELEAVGLDNDGTIKPINDLSYMPSGGWLEADIFDADFKRVSGEADRQLAIDTVGKYYRIVTPFTLPGVVGQIKSLDQILPIKNQQVDTITEDGIKKNKLAVVYGVWYKYPDGGDGDGNSADALTELVDDDDPQIYKWPFRIDDQRGLVIFTYPVFRNTGDSPTVLFAAAQILLRASCCVRDKETLALRRHLVARFTAGNFKTPTKCIIHNELQLTSVDGVTNAAEIDPECEHLLDGALQEYQINLPESATYAGLEKCELDGAIQQIIVDLSKRGMRTTISRNNEILARTLPCKQRRWAERLRYYTKTSGYAIGRSIGQVFQFAAGWWTRAN